MKMDCKILWVEDEDMLREIVCDLIRGEGFDCLAVSNGVEAREILQKEKFDILITDFQMPEMDGSQLLFWCRQNNLHLPVIFVSANVERLPKEELVLKDCCSSIIHKPFSIEDLVKEIENAKKRNHDFDCKGRVVPPTQGDFEEDFPGRHYLTEA